MSGRNAFDGVRLLLACLVVFEHSYFLVDNNTAREPLDILSKGQAHFGALAVFMFFAISGFLVTRSALTSSLPRYLMKRTARIAPGFAVATLVGLFVVGPLIAGAGYFGAQNWPVLGAMMLALKPANPVGVFTGNPVDLVHGTLWTIRYEFDCYLAVAILAVLGLLSGKKAIAAFGVIAAALLAIQFIPMPTINHGLVSLLISSPDRWVQLAPFFAVGSAFYIWRERIPKSPILLALCVLAVLITLRAGGLYWSLLFAGTYIALYTSLSTQFEVVIFGRRVDLSYGVYLYGWLIQQVLLHLFDLSPLGLFAVALPLTLVAAWLSWTFVEEPALNLVRRRHADSPSRT